MNKHLIVGLGRLAAASVGLIATSAFSNQSLLPQFSMTTAVAQVSSAQVLGQKLVSQNSSPASLPSIDGSTWMSGENIPWSTPVSVRDNRGGSYLAVFDRNYPTGVNVKQIRQTGEISNWSPHSIGLYGYGTQQSCLVVFVPICNTKHPTYPVSTATLKIGSRIFPLEGGNSQFAVNDELAYALAKAYPKKVLLHFTLADGSDTVTHPIGEATVKAWQTIYQNVPAPSEQNPGSLPSPVAGETMTATLPSDLVARLPVVDGATWRFTDDLPWSVPVLVKDEFDGNYLAVFDRDYQKNEWNANESGLISNWGQKFVGLHIYEIGRGTTYRTIGVEVVDLKVGDRTFHLATTNNQFAVTDDLAQALRSAEIGQVQISFANVQGKTIIHPIGDRTIEAWKTVYKANSAQ